MWKDYFKDTRKKIQETSQDHSNIFALILAYHVIYQALLKLNSSSTPHNRSSFDFVNSVHPFQSMMNSWTRNSSIRVSKGIKA